MNFFFFFCTAPTFVVENEDSVNRLKQPASQSGGKGEKKERKEKPRFILIKKIQNAVLVFLFFKDSQTLAR